MPRSRERCSLKLRIGNMSGVNEPVISFWKSDQRPYLWIGNNAKGDGWCYATVSGNERLRKFATELLKTIGPKKKGKS